MSMIINNKQAMFRDKEASGSSAKHASVRNYSRVSCAAIKQVKDL